MRGDGENGYRQFVDKTDNLNGRYVRVCSVHFVSAKPSQLYDSTHPDWVPFKNLVYVKQTVTIAGKVERYSRAGERNANYVGLTSQTRIKGWLMRLKVVMKLKLECCANRPYYGRLHES